MIQVSRKVVTYLCQNDTEVSILSKGPGDLYNARRSVVVRSDLSPIEVDIIFDYNVNLL